MVKYLAGAIALSGILSWHTPGMGQDFPSRLWHDGKIVMVDGDTLVGGVKYDLERDIVQLQNGSGKIEAVTARKLLFFEIFDRTVDRYRQFYALPYTAKTNNYQVPYIFEVLFEGKLTLLSRESIALQTSNFNGAAWTGGAYTREVLVHDFYFLDEKGGITQLLRGKKALFHIMRKRSHEVKKYIKDNKLRIDNKSDLTRVVAYFNSLITS